MLHVVQYNKSKVDHIFAMNKPRFHGSMQVKDRATPLKAHAKVLYFIIKMYTYMHGFPDTVMHIEIVCLS